MSDDISKMNIYQRIDAAYALIAKSSLEKSGTVKGEGGGYPFIPIADILNVVRSAHAAYGVKTVYGRPEYDDDQGEGKYQSGNWVNAIGHMTVILYGSGPDDSIETVIGFQAKDNSDKLNNKIYTNAERTLLRTLYALDAGDDPEEVNIVNDSTPIVKREDWRSQASADPFFGNKKPESAPVQSEPAEDIIGDRDPAQMRESLTMYMADPKLSSIVNACRQAWKRPISEWTDDEVRQIYTRCVKAKREEESA